MLETLYMALVCHTWWLLTTFLHYAAIKLLHILQMITFDCQSNDCITMIVYIICFFHAWSIWHDPSLDNLIDFFNLNISFEFICLTLSNYDTVYSRIYESMQNGTTKIDAPTLRHCYRNCYIYIVFTFVYHWRRLHIVSVHFFEMWTKTHNINKWTAFKSAMEMDFWVSFWIVFKMQFIFFRSTFK